MKLETLPMAEEEEPDDPIELTGVVLRDLFLSGPVAWNQWVAEHPNAVINFIPQHFDHNRGLGGGDVVSFDGYKFPKNSVNLPRGHLARDVSFSGADLTQSHLFIFNIEGEGRRISLQNCELMAITLSGSISISEVCLIDSTINGNFNAGGSIKAKVLAWNAKFGGLHWPGPVFSRGVALNGAEVDSHLYAVRTQFSGICDFSNATLRPEEVDFRGCRFVGNAIFDNLKEIGHLKTFSFAHSSFEQSLTISSAEIFPCILNLIGCRLAHPLALEALRCDLKRSSTGQFLIFKTLKKADDEMDAPRVRRLKELADNNRDQPKVLEYKVQEMQAARFHFTPDWQLPLEFLYWMLCDYGRSALRPVLWIIGLLLLTPFIYCYISRGEEIPTYLDRMALTGSHLLPLVPSFRGDLSETIRCLFPDGPTPIYYLVSISLTVLGPLLLYLTGLALRNKFRI